MATFLWKLPGTTPTTIEATDIFQFANGVFDGKITVGQYNGSSHVKSSVGANDSSANTPNNVKFISQTGGAGSKSQCDKGAGTILLSALTSGQENLLINFSDGASVITEDAIFYAYDGSTPATAPTGVTFVAAEVGDDLWTAAEGSASALALTNQTTNTSHDFHIAVSASPDSVGLKSAFAFRIELTYS